MQHNPIREDNNRYDQMRWEHAIAQYERAKTNLTKTHNPKLRAWYEQHMADIRARYPNVKFD